MGILKKVLFVFVSLSTVFIANAQSKTSVSGKITTTDNEAIAYATVYLKGTNYSTFTDDEGKYEITAPEGKYLLIASLVGYEPEERKVHISKNSIEEDIVMNVSGVKLDEVTVLSNSVNRVQKSAFNAVAVDTKTLHNSTKNLGDALGQISGMKLRETGGVGSDMQLMMDGFSGKHVKVFIDGILQDGVGSTMGINNIPVNFAKSIEVYKGVVPVRFGTDAIGGVVNIVTNKNVNRWFLDASYSYGSFNTHKSYMNFGRTFKNGLTYEINVFQNYSDNDYHIYAPIEDFETGRIDKNNKVKVKRFNDTFHNEAVIAKIGFTGKKWADRFILGFTFSNMYKEIQTGVRQEIVYGKKYKKGYSLMPSLEYSKHNLFVRGLDVIATVNYNRNISTNVDTASYKYNWKGEIKRLNSPGEQAYVYSRAKNDNWNGTFTVNYNIGSFHTITFNNVLNMFSRSNTSLLTNEPITDAIAKKTTKYISGLSYRFMPSNKWNISAFGKTYILNVSGPVAINTNGDSFVRSSKSMNAIGYGMAATYFILDGLQAKVSYEKAYRLPTIEEMFGDEDLENGSIGIKPENSNNVNLSLSYNRNFGNHLLYVEGGLIYRDMNDYIQRNIISMSGGKYAATYTNYGKVLTKGFNISARYEYKKLVTFGATFTKMDVVDNMKNSISNNAPNLAYKTRMPNIPYVFANSDLNFNFWNLGKKGNKLSVTYDNQYLYEFSFYSSTIGANNNDYIVPTQLSHNLAVSYSMNSGKYSLSVECKNFTNENLYDNFSLQKAGRAFYGKFRITLGN